MRRLLLLFLVVPSLVVTAAALPAGTAKKPVRVTVLEYEYGFKVSRTTLPAGKVTFVMGNEGSIVHNFDIVGVKVGPFLVSGQEGVMTVNLKKGVYTYVCSVKYHAAQGMQGTITVR